MKKHILQVNGIDTKKCTKWAQMTSLIVILLLLFSGGCKSIEEKAANRPSPLTSDSLVLESGKIWIEYSSPAVRGREIWGVLDPYDKVWRIGANDATVFYSDFDLVLPDSTILPKGKYSLFAIPREDEWTIIFNKEWEQWGAYSYDSGLDQLRVELLPYKTSELKERLTFDITESQLDFHWEYVRFDLPFEIR